MSKVAEAVTRVNERQQKQAKPIVLREAKVLVTEQPLAVKASGQLAFTRAADSDPRDATLLLFDPKLNAYRPVLTPPGTSWELVEKRQGPALWTPGKKPS